MRQKTLIFVWLVAVCALLVAGCAKKERRLYPYGTVEDGRLVCHFMDQEAKPAFPGNYDDVLRGFSGGYAIVVLGGKQMVIDEKGEDVLSAMAAKHPETAKVIEGYEHVLRVEDGLATLRLSDKTVLIDLSSGKVLLSGYDYIRTGNAGIYAVLEKTKWRYVRKDGSDISGARYSEALPFDGKTAVAARDGKVYRVAEDGTETELPYRDITRVETEPYVIALGENGSGLLNLRGDILIETLPGDPTELKDGLLTVMERMDGKVRARLYSIDGKRKTDESFDEIRILSKDFFAGGTDGLYALYTASGEKLTDPVFTYLSADHFDENGGVICGVENGKTVFLDQNGKRREEISPTEALSCQKDRSFVTVETEYGTDYYREGKRVASLPTAKPLGHLSVVYVYDDAVLYPVLLLKENAREVNASMHREIDRLRKGDRLRYALDLSGDILTVTLREPGREIAFMVDIADGHIVQPQDIFRGGQGLSEILERTSSADVPDASILSFSFDGDLAVYVEGDPLRVIRIPYGSIADEIDEKGGSFFRAKIAPKVNIR